MDVEFKRYLHNGMKLYVSEFGNMPMAFVYESTFDGDPVKDCDTLECIGIITISGYSEDACKIDDFKVRAEHRYKEEKKDNKKIGTILFQEVLEQCKSLGYKKMYVYPYSSPFNGESRLGKAKLYEIYEHLGFKLKAGADISQWNQEMCRDI